MITYTVQVDEVGNQFWYHGKELSRNDGPAAIFASGDRKWYQNGLLHRTNGPAIEWNDGDNYWYIHGQELTEEEFVLKTSNSSYLLEMTMEEICQALGKNVKILKS